MASLPGWRTQLFQNGCSLNLATVRLNQTAPVSILLVVELGLGLFLSGGWMNEATKKFLDGWRKIGSLHVTICSPPKDNPSIEAGVYIFKDGSWIKTKAL